MSTGLTHTLVVHVENKAGVLARVAGLFARRGFNIESLAVAPTTDNTFSRITIVVDAQSAPIEQVIKQLDKLINVVDITELTAANAVLRELLMVSVLANDETRGQIMDIVEIFEASVPNVGQDGMIISLSGAPRRLDDLVALLEPFGIEDIQRTGVTALPQISPQTEQDPSSG